MVIIKRYLSRLFLVTVSIFLALLISEAFVRVFFPYVRDHVLPGRLFDIDEHLGWKLKKEKKVIHSTRYFEVFYTTNEFGYRDKSRHILKNGSIYRVLLYGDSQVFGWGVSENRRFSNLIENRSPYLELWNLAVPAYGLDQQIASYQLDGAHLEADEVIFFVSRKTLDRTHREYMDGRPKPMFVKDHNGTLQFVPPKRVSMTRLLYEALSPLYLPHFLNRKIKILQAVKEGNDNGRNQERNAKTSIYISLVSDFEKEMLILARNIAVERNQKMTLLVELPKDMRKDLEDLCKHKDIGFVEIDSESEGIDALHGRHDPHWNPKAHQIIEEQIVSQVDWHIARK